MDRRTGCPCARRSRPARAAGAARRRPWPRARYGAIYVQCPGDTNGDSPDGTPDPDVKCMHLAGGDGFVTMADGKPLYIFGFSDVTGVPKASQAWTPAPSPPTSRRRPSSWRGRAVLPEPHQRRDGDAARPLRPALGALPRLPQRRARVRRHARELHRRQHGLHAHLLLQDRRARHLHVPLPRRGHRAHADGDARQPLRAAEAERLRHARDGSPSSCPPGHQSGDRYAYNDGDGSTRYDVEYPIQIGSFDPELPRRSEIVQPLPVRDHGRPLRRCSTVAATRTR